MGWADFATAAVQVAGAAYASNQAGKAANAAGNQAAAGAEKDAALSKYIYDDQRNLAMPGYQRGEWAGNALAQYLGMPAGYAPTTQAQAQPQSQLTAAEWYLRQNPDVQAHPDYGRDPYAHYQKYGQNEGRAWGVPTQAAPTAATTPATSAQAPTTAWLAEMFRKQPGYQFGLDEGNKQVQASAASRGGLLSGATLKALTQYGQNYADQKGWQPYLNQLQSMAGLSQTASSQIGNAGQNYASQAGNAFQNAGNARAQSTYAKANANMWGIQQGTNALGNYLGTYG